MTRLLTALLAGFLISAAAVQLAYAKEYEWQEERGRHTIVFYRSAPRDFVQSVEESAEDYYSRITRTFGFPRRGVWSYDERVKIYIYDNEDEYVTVGQQKRWSHGVASPYEKIIRTYPAASGFFDTTLPHELAHIVFREYVGYRTFIPTWFEEGVAMYAERAKRFGAHNAVREARRHGQFRTLEELTLTGMRGINGRQEAALFYTHAASIVKFMIDEHGKQKFVRFCRKLKEGKPFDWALDESYPRFKNTDRLNEAWVKFLDND
ncbi:MAG: hypothetical protein KC897_07355 [Candidatus Omnitrophica bacterium]|nr:hypothetical protein [Candidatus Omnitrophota bacterium]MCB9720842.1 hypothetical protein [Candidatus Omnitrophota bacterium]